VTNVDRVRITNKTGSTRWTYSFSRKMRAAATNNEQASDDEEEDTRDSTTLFGRFGTRSVSFSLSFDPIRPLLLYR
jgi:hypothetical protein